MTLDSNWRWLHIKDDYVNCYEGNLWDDEFCPDPATCTENCVLGWWSILREAFDCCSAMESSVGG